MVYVMFDWLARGATLDTRSDSVYVQSDVSAPTPAGTGRQRLIVGIVGLGILAAAAWLALIVVSRVDDLFLAGQGIGGLPPLPGVEREGAEGQLNILVMGLDRRPSEGNAITRTDTLFILTIDQSTKTAGILGIPRDSWVEIPLRDGDGFTESRVNTVFGKGESENYDGGGATLIKTVVERNFGIPIDRYVIIDFEGFIDLIDELGGIDVYVTEEVYDPTYSRTELPGDYTPLEFEVGEHHMDGQTALDYSRTRYGNSDLDRIQRQQQVIFAAIDKATEQDFVRLDKLTNLWGKYKDTIQTDINDIQAPGYASLAAQIDPSNITALSLASATVPYTTPFGEAVLLIDKDIVQDLVAALFTDTRLNEENARVEVRSSYGFTDEVIDYLSSSGFSSGSLSATTVDDTPISPLTEIIDFTGKIHTVERLADLLEVETDQIRSATDSDRELSSNDDTDVLVIMGADILALDFAIDAQEDLGIQSR
jgi:LCP family protein required for cell wall assembly